MCDDIGHPAMNCFTYVDLDDRISQLKANNRCTTCTSNQHANCNEVSRPCIICKTNDHVATVCKQHISTLYTKVKDYKAKKITRTDVCY